MTGDNSNPAMGQLLREAAALPVVPAAAASAYESAIPRLLAAVDAVVLARPDLDRLRGPLTTKQIHDNHVHHAALMAVTFRYSTYRQLATLLPWVYHSYHQHGVDFAYFPVELGAWHDAVRAQLGQGPAAEILHVYDWLLAFHQRVQALSAVASPFATTSGDRRWDSVREQLTEQLLAGDWRQGLSLLEASSTAADRIGFYDHALRSAMWEIGRRWEEGTISVAREHLATAAVARLLSAAPPPAIPDGGRKGKAVVTATTNEYHQVGAWLVADALDADGWNVRFLGANTPNQELMALLREESPDLLALSVSLPFNLRHAEDAIRSARELPECQGLHVLVGGSAFLGEPDLYRRLGADAVAWTTTKGARRAWGSISRWRSMRLSNGQ